MFCHWTFAIGRPQSAAGDSCAGAGAGAGGWKVHLAHDTRDTKHLTSSAAAKRQRPSRRYYIIISGKNTRFRHF